MDYNRDMPKKPPHVKDDKKTKTQLLAEIRELRRKVSDAEGLKEKFDRSRKLMRKAVAAAKDEKARSEGIIAALGDGISIQDKQFRVLYQNQIHKDMVGDHSGEYCFKAYQRKEKICDECHLAMSFLDGRIHKKEQFRVTPRGTIHYEIISSPLRNAKGEIVAGIEAVRDISERKKVEAEREALIGELEETLARINLLTGLLPICAWCKKVRDDGGYWQQVEDYLQKHSGALFTHGICPECLERVNREEE
jgi:signal transduction histidine kinase